MKNIGLFFGSFNPIHNGHTTLAQTILEQSQLNEIWFVVSPHNPLKHKADLLSEQQRLHMVDLAIRDIADMHSCDIEFQLPKPSYTINTLRRLSELYPEYKYTLIIGSDNLKVFHLWREYEYILRHYSIIVYPRKGDDINKLQHTYPDISIIQASLLPISSTEIRAMLKAQPLSENPAQQWLNHDVWDYIVKNNLYTTD